MNKRFQLSLARAAVAALGFYHLLTGVVMLVAPEWFFKNAGNFPPYNRHYIGDFATYQIPLGLALFFAIRRPFHNRLLILAAVLGNILHSFNHIYDDLAEGINLSGTTISLLVIGVIFLFLLFGKPQVTTA